MQPGSIDALCDLGLNGFAMLDPGLWSVGRNGWFCVEVGLDLLQDTADVFDVGVGPGLGDVAGRSQWEVFVQDWEKVLGPCFVEIVEDRFVDGGVVRCGNECLFGMTTGWGLYQCLDTFEACSDQRSPDLCRRCER